MKLDIESNLLPTILRIIHHSNMSYMYVLLSIRTILNEIIVDTPSTNTAWKRNEKKKITQNQ